MTRAIEEWLATADVSFAVYGPADVERISGLTTDMQRVWRRRGQLPSLASGHARFGIIEAIEITLRYAASKAGISPSELQLDLADAAKAAKFHGVFSHGGCEVIGSPDDVDHFLKIFEEDQGQLGSFLVGKPRVSNYLVLNEWHETRIVDDPEDLVRDSEELNLVFNLRQFGSRLVELGRKPVVTIRFSDRLGFRSVRRLTGVGANDS